MLAYLSSLYVGFEVWPMARRDMRSAALAACPVGVRTLLLYIDQCAGFRLSGDI